MAEHRRVEPRAAVAGTGMLTDPQRINDLVDEKARFERTWRNHDVDFGGILDGAPARGTLEDEPEGPPDRRRSSPPADGTPSDRTPSDGPSEREAEGTANEPGAAAQARTAAPGAPPTPRDRVATRGQPRVPPDPREAALRRQLAARERPAATRK